MQLHLGWLDAQKCYTVVWQPRRPWDHSKISIVSLGSNFNFVVKICHLPHRSVRWFQWSFHCHYLSQVLHCICTMTWIFLILAFPWGSLLSTTPNIHWVFSNNGGLYHEQLTSASHNLLMSSRSCSFVEMHVEATSCGTVTRSKLQVVKEGALKWISELSLAENNCNISAHLLPKDIFLGKSASYKFLVHFVINPSILGNLIIDCITEVYTAQDFRQSIVWRI